MFCAHLDTVPHGGAVEVVLEEGVYRSAGDTILGADNKAAVAVLLELAERHAQDPPPVGIELLLTVAEEDGLRGAKAFDVSALRAGAGFVLDHASSDRRGDHGGAQLPARGRRVRGGRGPRGDQARAGAQRDRRRGGRDRGDAARPARPGDDRERRGDRGRHRLQRRPVPLPDRGRGAKHRLGARRRGRRRDVRGVRLGRGRARLRRRGLGSRSCSAATGCRPPRRRWRWRRRGCAGPGSSRSGSRTGGGSDANALVLGGFDCVLLANGTDGNHTSRESVAARDLDRDARGLRGDPRRGGSVTAVRRC